MNILFVTAHPAQVHNFRLLKNILEKNGHKGYWLATNKDVSKYLLKIYRIDYSELQKPGKSFFSRLMILLKNTYIALRFLRKNNIDIVISRVSPYLTLAAFFLNTSHISLTDTESAGFYNWFFVKFVKTIITAKSFQKNYRSDQIRFNGNIELFYLHPNHFTPNKREETTNLLGIAKKESYIIMRFVSWDAYHDKGLKGFTDKNKIKAVKSFSRFARVFITAENELPVELETYRIKIPPEKMHDVLAHATLLFGESATMASESAVLGTPAIYLNENWLGYINEARKHGLVYSYKQSLFDQEKAIEKGIELLTKPELKAEMQKNRAAFLKDKIDVTAFMVWFIENYPESAKIMKENPDYQYRFK